MAGFAQGTQDLLSTTRLDHRHAVGELGQQQRPELTVGTQFFQEQWISDFDQGQVGVQHRLCGWAWRAGAA
jgi:hypothetical protein